MGRIKAYVCEVCGYVYEGDPLPERCPICSTAESFAVQPAAVPEKTLDPQLSGQLQQLEETEEQVNALDRTECEKIKNA